MKRRLKRWTRALLMATGVLAWAAVLTFALSDLGESEDLTWSLYSPHVSTRDMLLALSAAIDAPVRHGGSIELLVNGDAFLPALLEDLAGAERSILFMTYVWEPGSMSDQIFEVLTERARAGVEVRLMLDGHGSGDVSEEADSLREAGGRVHVFNPMHSLAFPVLSIRNHRRAIVVDGRVAYTGGVGVADTWLGDAQDPEHWRDDLVRVTGALALSVQAAFSQLWSSTTGEVLSGPDFFASDRVIDGDGPRHPAHVSVVSSPSSVERPLAKTWWLSFAGARERIWITTPYFVPDAPIRALLAERARDGVDVRLLTAGSQIDVAVVRWAARHFYAELLEAGVRIFEYEPTLIHSKLTVVDGIWSLVGSANLDVRSEELNQENVLAILDPEFAARLERRFQADLEHSREITRAAWRERPIWQRLRSGAASLLREQL